MDKYGNTPLHIAAKYGHELLISTLMTNGADTARYAPLAPQHASFLVKRVFLKEVKPFLPLQTWDPWNVPLALSCAVRVFRLLSQVTLLRYGLI